MDDKDNISSILDAINKINLKPIKKATKTLPTKLSIPKFNQDLTIPPEVDKLINEAEVYKKKKNISSKIRSIKTQSIAVNNESALILTEEVTSKTNNSKIENQKIIEQNNKIKNLEETEKKLRFQITNLQKNKSSLSNVNYNNNTSNETKNFISNTKENLKLIYSQVEKQKKIFVDLKNYSIKIERDSSVYKENYEGLVIKNNDLKIKLKITKEQITDYETNKKDLLSALDQLNEILSKSNIVGNISPNKLSLMSYDLQKGTKTDPID